MILQVHDELVFDIPKDEEEIWKEIVRESMENVLENRKSRIVIRDSEWGTRESEKNNRDSQNESRITNHESRLPPIRVDMHTGENWVAAKG